jgi:hypothetical protein
MLSVVKSVTWAMSYALESLNACLLLRPGKKLKQCYLT